MTTTLQSSPPPEIYDAMAVASQACDRLAAAGQRISFELSAAGVAISLKDRHGVDIAAMTPSQALEIAAGAELRVKS